MSFGFGFGFTKITAAIRAAFSPSSLFAANEPGVWFDPSDLSTLYQDAAGTVPVTGVEQPVGRILDKSGRGFHATQATATSRPVLRQDGNGKHYLYFDGVDDFLVTPTITPGTDKAQVFAGVRKLGNSQGIVLETSSNLTSKDGTIAVQAPGALTNSYRFVQGGGGVPYYDATSFLSPITNVLSCLYDKSVSTQSSQIIPRVDGVTPTLSAGNTATSTGNFLAYPLYIGRRGGTTLPFNGHLYSMIVRFGSNLPIGAIEQAEAWINGKTGAY